MMDIKAAGDFVTNQFVDGKTAAIIDGPWAAANYKDAGVNFGVAKIPALKMVKNTKHLVVVKHG